MRLLSTRAARVVMALDRPSPGQVRRLARMVGEHPLPPEIADLLLATERHAGFGAAFRADLAQLLRLRGARPGPAHTPRHFADVGAPVLVVIGADDPFGGPDIGRRIAEASPQAESHVVPGGHAPWIHHADRIAPVITAFVDRLGDAPTATGGHR
jgi:2-hydroxy-6-oxonona-2,4-dienedioate hydrolase